MQLGWSYAQSARFLEDALAQGQLAVSHDMPVDYLYAHAVELMLKGCLLEHDPAMEVESYGHDLLRLYDCAKSRKVLGDMLARVERSVRERWKSRLRTARDSYRDGLGLGQCASDLEDFGIFDNDVIGNELPDLRRQVSWLSDRHRDKGGKFRYLQSGFDSRKQIRAFGLSDDVVRLTSYWACEKIYDCFRRY